MPLLQQFLCGTELFIDCAKQVMQNNNDKRSNETKNSQQPGDMNSFNQRNEEKSTAAEGAVKKEKDENESYMDYNGNSEENAPARARE